MRLPDFIRLGQQEPPLRFLVIGGWAVAAHGHTRMTFDVDFLIRREERQSWFRRTAQAGIEIRHETRTFAQLVEPRTAAVLDLMLVSDDTFEGLWRVSAEVDFGECRARVPSLDHVLALKLHVLKQGLAHRTAKDAEDVEMLARRHGLNLSDPHYEALFLKHGTRELLDTFIRILSHPR